MVYTVCFVCSFLCFVLGIVIDFIIHTNSKKKNQGNNDFKLLVQSISISTFISIYILAIPVNLYLYSGILETIVINGIYTFKVFTTSASFIDFSRALMIAPNYIQRIYSAYGSLLFIFAPILSVGMVLSLFKVLLSKIKLACGFYKDIFIFSDLNKKSISLAKSCYKTSKNEGRKPIIIFSNTNPKKANLPADLPAIYFNNEINDLNQIRNRNDKHSFYFLIGDNQTKNISDTLRLINTHRDEENTKIFIFDDTAKSDIIIGSAVTTDIKASVRRVNVPQSLIYNHFYTNNIFTNIQYDNTGKKELNVKIIGFGNHGEEILKAYLWGAPMNDLSLNIDVYDSDESVEERFYSRCPELKTHNGMFVEGDANYKLSFYNGYNATQSSFDENIINGNSPSTIYIALGNDILNIEIAIKLRILFARYNMRPEIKCIIYNTSESNIINQFLLKSEKGISYNITALGDIESTYSYDVIINSDLEEAALKRHLKYVNDSNPQKINSEIIKYFNYEYYSKSSKASVIRNKLRQDYGIKGSEKLFSNRSDDEKNAIQIIEHSGWNNYMRTEGYVRGERDDFAKTHNLLIPYDELPEIEKIKDNC